MARTIKTLHKVRRNKSGTPIVRASRIKRRTMERRRKESLAQIAA